MADATPSGAPVTFPRPVPAFVTDNLRRGRNLALMLCGAPIVTMHGPVVGQPPPDHSAKTFPASGAAVSVTAVSRLNAAESERQAVPQSIALSTPAGAPVTTPVPVPSFARSRRGRNVAVTVIDAATV